MEESVIETVHLTVAVPPALGDVGAEPAHACAQHGRVTLGLLNPASASVLLVMFHRIALHAHALRLLVRCERVAREVGHGERTDVCLGPGLLEVGVAVVGMADGYDLVLEVDVAPRKLTNLAALHADADCEEVGDARLLVEVELGDERADGLRLECAARLGVARRGAPISLQGFLIMMPSFMRSSKRSRSVLWISLRWVSLAGLPERVFPGRMAAYIFSSMTRVTCVTSA